MEKFNKKICIIGASGFGSETLCIIADIVKETNQKIEDLVCFMVHDNDFKEKEKMGIEIIPESLFNPDLYNVVVAIGDPIRRKYVVNKLPSNTTFAKIIHPTAIISKWVEIGDGCIITAGSIITCNIKIGNHAHINLHTTIGHDCKIGDFFTTAPGVNISGICDIGESVYFGTNSSIRQGINVCNEVTIGMGAVVVKNIIEPGVYVGSPAKKIEKSAP